MDCAPTGFPSVSDDGLSALSIFSADSIGVGADRYTTCGAVFLGADPLAFAADVRYTFPLGGNGTVVTVAPVIQKANGSLGGIY